MKIPTAEEYFNLYSNLCQFEEGSPEYLIDKEDFKTAMTEFAKLHVKGLKEVIAKKASKAFGQDYNETLRLLEDIYPETNIK